MNMTRLQQFPGRGFALSCACAVLALGAAAVFSAGIANVGAPVKLAMLLGSGAVGVALVLHRPILFPFVFYCCAIPFDNLLQTGGGTITKFLALGSAGTIALILTDPRRRIAPPLGIAGWALFLLWSVASLTWAEDPRFGMDTLLAVLQLFAFYLILSVLRVSFSEVRWMMIATLIGGVGGAIYGLYMSQQGHMTATDPMSQRLNIQFQGGAFINADHFAGALVFPLAIAMVGFVRLRGWKQYLSIAAFLICMTGVFVSATRGALIAALIMACYIAVVERRVVQLAVLSGIALLASLGMPNMWARFNDPSQGELGGREGIWKIGIAAFRERWFAGFGTGNFRRAYESAYLAASKAGPFVHRWSEDSHNLLVSTSAELGIVGLVFVLLGWALQFRIVANVPRATPVGAFRTAIEAATIGLFIVANTVDLMWYKYLWIVFMLAVLVRNASLHPSEGERSAIPSR